jgi:hypothetical protein
MNALWNTYTKEKGIVLEFTTPYAHQQNGVAECSMRMIVELGRSMMAESGLPSQYWADAFVMASYIKNLLPSSRIPGKIPTEIWMGRRQDISHLCAFGSLAYAHIPADIGSSKLAPQSAKLILIGYYGTSGYKLLDQIMGTVSRSQDIIFEEGKTNYAERAIPPILDDTSNSQSPLPDAWTSESVNALRPLDIALLHNREVDQTLAPKVLAEDSDAEERGIESELTAANPEASDVPDAVPVAPLRRSGRISKPLQRRLENLEYEGRARVNVVNVDGDTWVPKTYREAMYRPELWLAPMEKEYRMMKEKGVFEAVDRPVGKNVVESKWVYTLKFDEDGNMGARKARLVAKGFTQVLGEDYDEMYASVARLELIRMVCVIVAAKGMRLWQVDFVSAFLNSDNRFEVYMEPPRGFEEGEGKVWRLLKTLYGTMQGAHDWAQTLDKTYRDHGYYKSKADSQVRLKVDGEELTLTSTWTDDVLGASTTKPGEMKVKSELASSYKVKDLGDAKLILGMKIDRDINRNIRLSQKAFCERILERFNLTEAKPCSTPLPASITLTKSDSPQNNFERQEMSKVPYREALGALMWLQVATRPDLSFAVNLLSRFANDPGRLHWQALKHTLEYVKGTTNYGITYRRGGSLKPKGYVDAAYAGDSDTSRSTEGHIFFVAGGAVSWGSKRQETVAVSTVEAEFMAFTRAAQQAMWLEKFLDKVGLTQPGPTIINADNSRAIANTKYNKNHR